MTSEGFWLDLLHGRWMVVRDHAFAVKNEPSRFGLTAERVAYLNPSSTQDYNLLRLLAIQCGWVRVRTSSDGSLSAESWCSSLDDVVASLVSFLKRQSFGPLTWVRLHDLKGRRTFQAHLADLASKP